MTDLRKLMEEHVESPKLMKILENNLSNKKFEFGPIGIDFEDSIVNKFSVGHYNMLPDKRNGKMVFTIPFRVKKYYGGKKIWSGDKWVDGENSRSLFRYYSYRYAGDLTSGMLYIWLISDGYSVVAQGGNTSINPVKSFKVMELSDMVEKLKSPHSLIVLNDFYMPDYKI